MSRSVASAGGVSAEVAIHQLLREWPPGYGGVGRVAHELGECIGARSIFSLDCAGSGFSCVQDALPGSLIRARRLRSDRCLRPPALRPLPCRSLILSSWLLRSRFMVICRLLGFCCSWSWHVWCGPAASLRRIGIAFLEKAWFEWLFIWVLPVDCFAGSSLSICSRHNIACVVC